MENLFIIERYKSPNAVPQKFNKIEEFDTALKKLLDKARDREQCHSQKANATPKQTSREQCQPEKLNATLNQTNHEELQSKIVKEVPILTSPRAIIKRKLFLSPDTVPKKIKKIKRCDQSSISENRSDEVSARESKYGEIPSSKEILHCDVNEDVEPEFKKIEELKINTSHISLEDNHNIINEGISKKQKKKKDLKYSSQNENMELQPPIQCEKVKDLHSFPKNTLQAKLNGDSPMHCAKDNNVKLISKKSERKSVKRSAFKQDKPERQFQCGLDEELEFRNINYKTGELQKNNASISFEKNQVRTNEEISSKLKFKKDLEYYSKIIESFEIPSLNEDLEVKYPIHYEKVKDSNTSPGKLTISTLKENLDEDSPMHSSKDNYVKPVSKKRAKKSLKISEEKLGEKQAEHEITVPKINASSVEGFTVIGQEERKKVKQVSRFLPKWLAEPVVISANIQDNKVPIEKMTLLDPILTSKLKENGITHFFPVQQEVIPWLLKSFSTSILFRPPDICVSAPTGSGKTLTYVLPILHAIKDRLVPTVRVLVVLPVKDLAIQVYKVFETYARNTPIKVALLVGQKSHEAEVEMLVRPKIRGGFSSLVDIVVATPGSLLHHIQRTEGFSLHNLRFLVIDEADRMMEDIQEGWVSSIEKAVQSKKTSSCLCRNKAGPARFLSGPIIPCCLSRPVEPCQKLLYSATLSQDPEKLRLLSLFNPKLFTTVVEEKPSITQGEFIGKFTTPEELKELIIVCESQMKPLMVWYLLTRRKFSRVLCFTNTVENSRRLTLLLKTLGEVSVEEFSSHLKAKHRKSILNKFNSGKLDIVVCSDLMTRGMDMENVNYVICYDMPPYLKTYIHRIGRTARAGRGGKAVTLLHKGEVKKFKHLMSSASRPVVSQETVSAKDLVPFEEQYRHALESVGKEIIKMEAKVKQSKSIFYNIKK